LKYVQINAYSGGWADSIIFKKHRELVENGDESWVFWARGKHEQDEHLQCIASYPEVCLDALQTRLDGKPGFHSKGITRRLLKKLDEIDPDVVHLHLLLGYYINVEILFEWLAAHRCKVVWTLHDCWAFTGHCIYFTYAKCAQWRSGCAASTSCPQKRTYPETFAGDKAVCWSFERKKRLFTMLPPERVQLITPSQWLADLVKQSFLSKYDVKVVHNTINTDVFKPTPSDFRERYGLGSRFVVLGVASKWSERKGLGDFIRLAKELDSEQFAVVVVGLDAKQITQVQYELPSAVALPKTSSVQELAEVYTAVDVFFNPTTEDNYPTVNLEAEACGTRVVTYDTGGCRETLHRVDSHVVGSVCEALEILLTLQEGTDTAS
jgi:putative colanic acid biosynthesis glycosyltransferase